MADRKTALMKLGVGDIFQAESPNGASLICLILSVTKSAIEASTVTTQMHLIFDRQTGIAKYGKKPILCTIDSIAPLPEEIHNVMVDLDRKFEPGADAENVKLTRAEIAALVYIDSFYSSNPL
jgi:hypothetical protein